MNIMMIMGKNKTWDEIEHPRESSKQCIFASYRYTVVPEDDRIRQGTNWIGITHRRDRCKSQSILKF